ncbi:RHS repeat-associated core domain-containing protein [Roseiconus nitratireducens]|uniref:RHS repeat-associated core domain-containing protein n=1 Tax=Roseiconus nitratireducens TaxID=2605748 RepID=A0A5M6CVP2_9BACT|nr:RHS repeat-associated core domain-containing protein [Roseiconus nitratireducens]KAA5539006.1 RHS repeat-associated core domain-containing protein [Roseiconus nitratireducens]
MAQSESFHRCVASGASRLKTSRDARQSVASRRERDGSVLGRRVARDDGTTDTIYVPSGQQTIADYASDTAATSPMYNYVYTSYIDEPVVREGSGGHRYYHRTQQYSIIALTDSAGTIKERYAYDAYGEVSIFDASGGSRSGSVEENRFTYTGREWDDRVGLYHYRARMYDPLPGRFLGRDPIGFEGSPWNLYASLFGLAATDPSGQARFKRCEDAAIQVGIACLAAGGSTRECQIIAASTYATCISFVIVTWSQCPT